MRLQIQENPTELLGHQTEQLGEGSGEGRGLPPPTVVGHVQRVPTLVDAGSRVR